MNSLRSRKLIVLAGLFAASAACVAAQDDRTPRRPVAVQDRQSVAMQALDVPGTRIYRSVGPDGAVAFSDEPARGSQSVQIRSFASSSDAEALATAQRQKAYWKSQAEAFARRQQERTLADERDRAERDRDERERALVAGIELVPRRYLRSPVYGAPMAPAVGFAPVYTSSPGVGAPAGFIGSGFSTAR